MTIKLKALAGVALSVALAGCSSDHMTTGSVGGGVTGGTTPVAVPKLVDLLGDGKTTVTGTSPELLQSAKKGTVTPATADVTANVVNDSNGDAAGLHVVVKDDNGTKDYDLTVPDSTGTQLSSADGAATFSVQTGTAGATDTIDQLVSDTASTHYHTILGYTISNTGTPTQRGYVALGSETTAADMPTSATATYKGKSLLEIEPTTGFTGADADRKTVKGALTLNADFGAGTISGSVGSVTSRSGTGTFTDVTGGAMTVGSGKISGDDITATMTPNAAVTSAVGHSFSGAVTGKFYGPNADELGGTVAVTGSGVAGTGFVTANKQ